MDETGVRPTAEQVLALAPDAASRKAGTKLGTAGPWSDTGGGGAEGAVWGLCAGSGGKPYRTVVDITGPAYTCSCPSRKFPCKHALGLLLLLASDEQAVDGTAPAPGWAEEWLAKRRERAGERGTGSPAEAAPGKPADPEAVLRRAERRAARITAGATELEQRLTDLLRGGLAAAEQSGYGLWEETAARMVDAQAPGLAGRVRELGAIPGSGPGWPVRLLEESALLHLLSTAWLGRDRLPEPLAATVRTRVGLPSAAGSAPVRDHWLVLAQSDSSDGKLITRRIRLYGRDSGRSALVLSFGAAGRSPQLGLPVGLMIEAEILPHPGAGQLRADWGRQFGPPGPIEGPPPGGSTGAAIEAYGSALRADPWLDSVPVTLRQVVPVQRGGGGWQLADADGESALPLASTGLSRSGLWKLAALSGGGPLTVFGEFGHRGFQPLAAWAEDLAGTVPLT
ncbi:SWIM zinc finger family protein [Streptomyces sp. NBC_01429]|uniref:SWIM zinc finger family protein n=1 Tax=Streptomyces sp. NBC_01429 TaxID=2903862 RepID=UPI002E2CEF19|nr:SWIM zinc finger family protein [Streptomyces sp. NBC_01429]